MRTNDKLNVYAVTINLVLCIYVPILKTWHLSPYECIKTYQKYSVRSCAVSLQCKQSVFSIYPSFKNGLLHIYEISTWNTIFLYVEFKVEQIFSSEGKVDSNLGTLAICTNVSETEFLHTLFFSLNPLNFAIISSNFLEIRIKKTEISSIDRKVSSNNGMFRQLCCLNVLCFSRKCFESAWCIVRVLLW